MYLMRVETATNKNASFDKNRNELIFKKHFKAAEQKTGFAFKDQPFQGK